MIVPDGWKLVPVARTDAMVSAARMTAENHGSHAVWAAELAAAPEPPAADLEKNIGRLKRIAELAAERDALRADAERDDPLRALIAKHAGLLADGPYAHYCYFELAYTRHTGWMAWLCSNQREQDPDRVVLAHGQGSTPDEACRNALTGNKEAGS
jgi:hypothetical protein